MDHVSLSKLAQKAAQSNVDLDNATLAEVAKAVAAVVIQRDKMEAAARKMVIAIKRGDTPDSAAYAKPRDKMIALVKSLQRSTKTYAGVLKAKTKLCKGDPKAAKLAAEVDKEIDEVNDALADLVNVPEPGELILAMLRGHKVEKREEKDKDKDADIPVKRSTSVDKDAPGTSFMAEVEFFKAKVPSLELKGVLKHEQDIKDWDLGPQLKKTKKAALRELKDYLDTAKEPSRPVKTAAEDDDKEDAKERQRKDKEEIATIRAKKEVVDDVLACVAKARNAAGQLRVVTTAVQKLRAASPRETSAVNSLTASMKQAAKAVTDANGELDKTQGLCIAVMAQLKRASTAAKQRITAARG